MNFVIHKLYILYGNKPSLIIFNWYVAIYLKGIPLVWWFILPPEYSLCGKVIEKHQMSLKCDSMNFNFLIIGSEIILARLAVRLDFEG